jgi:Ca2+/Na+ antiporter
MDILIPILLILATMVIIWRACDGFEAASEYLGRNLSDGVRGATINAIGSSIPELLTTVFFLFVMKDGDGFAGGIGTTAGSAVFNAVIIPAAVIMVVTMYGIAKSVQVSKKVILRDGIALLLAEVILIYFVSGETLDWWQGAVLMAVYVIYIVYMFSTMTKGGASEEEEEEEEEEGEVGNRAVAALTLDLETAIIGKNEITTSRAWTLIISATLVIGAACYLLVFACEGLGEAMGVPIYFVAVVLAAAATSVPDTIISIRDGLKGNYDDAVANAIGSNIFDICFALGLPLFLYTLIYGPISMGASTVQNIGELRVLLLIVTFVGILIFFIGKGMGQGKAILLFLLYVVFLSYVLGRAVEADWAASLAEILMKIGSVFDNLRPWEIVK